MQITRTEVPTGGPNRTKREEIISLNTGTREVEPEYYLDFSESEGWSWDSNPAKCTWDIQLDAVRASIAPFEVLDSQAAEEQKDGDDDKGGVYTYPFSNLFLPIGDGEDDGDLNSANFDEKMAAFLKKYGTNGKPAGGTEIMTAIRAADKHFMTEFNDDPRDTRPVRARVVWTDGALHDAGAFQAYLSAAVVTSDGYGAHGDWDEVWAVAILGEGRQADGSNPGKVAYEQYQAIARNHSWIHAYYFEGVVNPAEIAEDMAIAVVPTQA
jgi:hypothetical protein